jgi:arylsulfatase A
MTNKLISTLLIAGVASTAQAQHTERPNIIFILADDLGYGDIGCYGQQIIKTPNIDKLASEGMLFTQHYSGSAVSAPSRSCLLTGLHTGHTPIRGNEEINPEGQMPLPAGTFTIAHLLKSAGYITGAFGKWGLGFPGSEGDPLNMGFDEFYGYNCQRLAHHYYPPHLYHNHEKIKLNGNSGDQRNEYAQDSIHQQALTFIRRNAGNHFFAYLPYLLPHAELTSPDDSISKLYRSQIQDPKPYIGSSRGYNSTNTPHADFASMVARLDAYVGQITTELKQLGIEKNTIVIFTSDNGPHKEGGADPDFFNSNGPLRGLKRDLYEGGIRIPLIVSWPNVITKGEKSDHISAFWDMMPTLKELCGSNDKIKTDGISFHPTLVSAKTQKEHQYLYWEFHEEGGKVAVRMGDWKGIKLGYGKNPEGKMLLFNLSQDINESNDIAAQNPEVVRKIETIIKKAHTKSNIFTFDVK